MNVGNIEAMCSFIGRRQLYHVRGEGKGEILPNLFIALSIYCFFVLSGGESGIYITV